MRRTLIRGSATATVVATAVVLGLICPSIAIAGQPERSQWSLQVPGTINCGTFQDNFTDFFDVAETDRFDRNGNLVQVVLNIAHTSNDMNSETGLTIHEHGHFVDTFDLLAGTYTISGNVAIVAGNVAVVPGLSVSFTGHFVWNTDPFTLDDFLQDLVFMAVNPKNSEVLLGGQVLCDALA